MIQLVDAFQEENCLKWVRRTLFTSLERCLTHNISLLARIRMLVVQIIFDQSSGIPKKICYTSGILLHKDLCFLNLYIFLLKLKFRYIGKS